MSGHHDVLIANHPAAVASKIEAIDAPQSKRFISPARLAANRANAQKSTGPRTAAGKQRSAFNATRHGILGQVITLSEDDMPVYVNFLAEYAEALAPANAVETQLAHSCADLQFRLNRIAAAEHNLFTVGYEQNAHLHTNDESHVRTALTFTETLIRSKDPLATLSLYEQRLHRRLMQTLKELTTMQGARRKREKEDLEEMRKIAVKDPDLAETVEPADFGFVCSTRDWRFAWKREQIANASVIQWNRQQNTASGPKREALDPTRAIPASADSSLFHRSAASS